VSSLSLFYLPYGCTVPFPRCCGTGLESSFSALFGWGPGVFLAWRTHFPPCLLLFEKLSSFPFPFLSFFSQYFGLPAPFGILPTHKSFFRDSPTSKCWGSLKVGEHCPRVAALRSIFLSAQNVFLARFYCSLRVTFSSFWMFLRYLFFRPTLGVGGFFSLSAALYLFTSRPPLSRLSRPCSRCGFGCARTFRVLKQFR